MCDNIFMIAIVQINYPISLTGIKIQLLSLNNYLFYIKIL